MKKLLFILPAVLLFAAACNRSTPQPPASSTNSSDNTQNTQSSQNSASSANNAQSPTMVKVALSPQNNSGQSGMATITEEQGKAKVILNITGQPATVAEPAHIHFGSCATLGDVKYALSNVSVGASQTMLPISLAELLAEPFAINVHKSATESSVYVACGDSLQMNKSFPHPETLPPTPISDPPVNNRTNGY